MSGNNGSRGDSSSSGSGTSAGGGKSKTGQKGSDICGALVQVAPINSPKAPVLASLKIGDELAVVLQTSGTRVSLVLVDKSGATAGSLTHRGYLQLIECIEAGYKYKATLTKKSAGLNEVRIMAAS